MNLDWLAAALVCDGRIVRPSMNPSKMTREDLPDLCLRMCLIMDTIEFPRCEGRLMNVQIFDSIDRLHDEIRRKATVLLDVWLESISYFGEYYGLLGSRVIEVSPLAMKNSSSMFEEFEIAQYAD